MTQIEPPVFNFEDQKPELVKSNGRESQQQFMYEVGNYRVFELHKHDKLSQKIFHDFIFKSLDFIRKYQVESEPGFVVNVLHQAFEQDSPLVLMMAAVDQEDQIVAHAISYMEKWHALGNVGFILQVENNTNEFRIMKVGMDLFKDWMERINVQTMLTITTHRKLVRLFRKFGFNEYRTILRYDLAKKGEQVRMHNTT